MRISYCFIDHTATVFVEAPALMRRTQGLKGFGGGSPLRATSCTTDQSTTDGTNMAHLRNQYDRNLYQCEGLATNRINLPAGIGLSRSRWSKLFHPRPIRRILTLLIKMACHPGDRQKIAVDRVPPSQDQRA